MDSLRRVDTAHHLRCTEDSPRNLEEIEMRRPPLFVQILMIVVAVAALAVQVVAFGLKRMDLLNNGVWSVWCVIVFPFYVVYLYFAPLIAKRRNEAAQRNGNAPLDGAKPPGTS